MNKEERERILSGLQWQRETANTLVDADALRAQLPEIAVGNSAVDDEENAIGLRCVASVIFNEYSEPMAGVSISGPTARLTDATLSTLGALVAGITNEITAELGGRRPNRSSGRP